MRFCLLASGSKGNCVWIEDSGRAAVVDNGLSVIEFTRRARAAGLDPARLRHVVVSHEHADHLAGVGPLARKLGLTVHMAAAAFEAAGSQLGRVARLRKFSPGDELDLGTIALATVSSSHDAAAPVVFVASGQGRSLGLATDLGVATVLVRQSLRGLDGLILESNHDPAMLLEGPYPLFLKQRVRGRRGHLSNEDAARVVAEMNHGGLREVVLAHLSETNNTPSLARQSLEAALEGSAWRPRVTVAGQWEPTPVFEI
ncbi:MAG: MBL fold metallo-hydrolase [Deltaproteobacteria bacterium]|jgi:phosphoribosyl 1,2-cyclic phosphodiesterase|nr:MBL fold metallo-hydrolase [Deltaproteobacteria bacterium]